MPIFRVKVKVAQSCLTLGDPMDYTVHRILQDRILGCVVLKPFGEENTIIIHFIYEIAKTTWKLAFIFHFSLKYL